MTIRFACPYCRREMLLETVHEGHAVPCPHCTAPVDVPRGAVSAAQVPEPKRHAPEDGLGIASAIVGCASLVFALCGGFTLLAAPLALVLGIIAVRRRRAAGMPAVAGWIGAVSGGIGTALLLLGLVGAALFVLFAH